MKRFSYVSMVLLILSIVTGCSSFKNSVYDLAINADRSRSDLVPGSIEIDGEAIAYLERKGDGEIIVLIHGFGANKDNWIRFVRHIPKQYRIVAFDMAGHGDNNRALEKTYSIDYITSIFAQAADAMALEKFHIAGNSMGGYISMLYTSNHPGRVHTMCLIDAAGLIDQTPQPSDLLLALENGQSPLTPTTHEDYSELLDYAFHKRPFIPWPIISVLADRAVESGEFTKKMWKDFHSDPQDVFGLLPGFDLPVLVIWGDQDRILHVSTTEVLERFLPDVETIILKDCGHMPMLERPEETAGHYVSFLIRHTQ
ncbi:MAG TPA: alpha/beta hydrolase [Deltaproteobacteria bacterium]|nr:alpha/beta hydrolase [Deltaproteobacteria bacterium]